MLQGIHTEQKKFVIGCLDIELSCKPCYCVQTGIFALVVQARIEINGLKIPTQSDKTFLKNKRLPQK